MFFCEGEKLVRANYVYVIVLEFPDKVDNIFVGGAIGKQVNANKHRRVTL